EKQAALDVVKRRLDEVGLGPFSLDLHGRNQTVTAVREQLATALDTVIPDSPGWDVLRAGYRAQVQDLARYPRQVHDPGPAGMSLGQARQILLELDELGVDRTGPAVTVPAEVVARPCDTEQVYRSTGDLVAAVQDLGTPPGACPWRWAGATTPEQLD